MKSAERFLVYCKLTCLGGSDKGTCACLCPSECAEVHHPEYDHYRQAAIARMFRFINNMLPDKLRANVDSEDS